VATAAWPPSSEGSECHRSVASHRPAAPLADASLTLVTAWALPVWRQATGITDGCKDAGDRGERPGGRAYDSDSDSSDVEDLPLWRRASQESELPSMMDFENMDALAVQREAQRLAAKQAVDRISVSSIVCSQLPPMASHGIWGQAGLGHIMLRIFTRGR